MDFIDEIFGTREDDRNQFGVSPLPTQDIGSFLNPPEVEIPYRRNFFERVFAPFEGPQQALFSFTRDVAEDGFQFRDIGAALGHGFSYANPFGNQEPIRADEVGDILFGDRENRWADLGQSVAVSLLFDPLAIVPLARVAKIAGPGTRVDEVMAGFRRATGRRLAPVGQGVVRGLERGVDALAGTPGVGANMTQRFGEAFISKWFRTPDEFRRRVDNYQEQYAELQREAAGVIRDSKVLGGVEGSRLMAEALQSHGFYSAARTGSEAEGAVRAFESVMNRARSMGIADDDFLSVYSRARDLDDRVGDMLFSTGLVGKDEFEGLYRQHLRRRYRALDNPAEAVERIEALAMPSKLRFSQEQLYENLNAFRKDLDEMVFRPPEVAAGNRAIFDMRETIRGGEGAIPDLPGMQYFKREGGAARFQTRRFVEDFTEYVNQNPNQMLDEVLAYVNDEMLAGVTLPGKFNVSLANHLTGASFKTKSSQEIADQMRSALHNPGVTFYEFRDRIEKVAARQDLPPEIREALDEVLEFQPRLAAQTLEAGLAGTTRQFLDDLAGVVRDPTDPTNVLDVQGTRLMSATREGIGPDAVQITDAAFGEHVQGMWVQPSVARHLQNIKRVMARDETSELGRQMLDTAERWTSTFKHLKVTMDPTAHFRNMLGNMVLADISGINPWIGKGNLVSATREIMGEGGGRYLKMAEEAGVGLFLRNFNRQELDTMANAIARVNPKNDQEAIRALGDVFNRLADFKDDAFQFAGRAYNFNESVFKLSAFISRYDETVSNLARRGIEVSGEMQHNIVRQAAQFADRALFDYGDVPGIVDKFRRYGIVPFLTFPYKATLRTAEVLMTHPHRVLKYPRIARDINNEFAPTAEQQRQSIHGLPTYMRESMVVRLPWQDGFGRDQYLDMSYFLPWQSIVDLKESIDRSEGPLPRDGLFAVPILQLIDAARTGKKPDGSDIATEDMDMGERFRAYGNYFWEFMAPPSFPGGSRAQSLGRTMMAMAQSDPGPNPLLEYMGRAAQFGNPRADERGLDDILRPPAAQANITGTADDGQFSFGGDVIPGSVASLFGVNTTGSDSIRTGRSVQLESQATMTELQSRRRQIISSNLSREEKLRRILQIQAEMNRLRLETSDELTRIFR